MTTPGISRCPSPTTRPTTAVANTVAAVVYPAQHLVMMPARAYGLLCPVTAAATAAPEPIRLARSV